MCHPESLGGNEPVLDVERLAVRIPVSSGEAMPATLFVPTGSADGVVMLVPDIYGPSDFYRQLSSRLAEAGFAALLPDFFFRQGPLPIRDFPHAAARRSLLDEHRTITDLSEAATWLRQSRGGETTAIGTLGFCLGGTLVLDLAAERTDLATVCFYGFPAREATAGPLAAPAPLERIADISGPILGFWGTSDDKVGIPNVAALAAGLAEHNTDFEHVLYNGVGHGFMSLSELEPSHDAYEPSRDAWNRTLGFLRQHALHRQPTGNGPEQ